MSTSLNQQLRHSAPSLRSSRQSHFGSVVPMCFLVLVCILSSSSVLAQAELWIKDDPSDDGTDPSTSPKGNGPLSQRNTLYTLRSPDDDSLYLFKAALNWEYLGDYRKALDTMRLYAELHPFAVYSPGEVITAIVRTLGETAQLPNRTENDYILEYNWLVKIQPVNPDRYYQAAVIGTLASTLEAFDLNAGANMWYNYSLLFPDTGDVNLAWRRIKSIRNYQKEIPEDTTEFYVLRFPLQPKMDVKPPVAQTESIVGMSVIPNPAASSSTLILSATESTIADIRIFDVLGKDVMAIYSGILSMGISEYPLTLSNLSAGTYYVRVQHRGGVETQSLVIDR